MRTFIRTSRNAQRGLSIVEILVGLTLGLFLLGGMTTLFVNNSQTRGEVEKLSRQIENGRYAMQLLSDDLQLAGYLAEFSPVLLADPAAKPDPCATAVADLNGALPLHVQGYDSPAASPLTCITDLRAGTDILVVRRVATCVPGQADCEAVPGGSPRFQASLCYPAAGTSLAGKELASTKTADSFVLDTDAAKFLMHQKDCTTIALIRRYLTHIYFVANNNKAGDGIPTLKRAELGDGKFTVAPLVEGVENLQVEYGFVNAGNLVYSASPDGFNGCVWPACAGFWRNTLTAKVHLLARNLQTSAGYKDGKTYTLGEDAAGNPNTSGPFNDAYRRHAYSATVRLANPALRLQ